MLNPCRKGVALSHGELRVLQVRSSKGALVEYLLQAEPYTATTDKWMRPSVDGYNTGTHNYSIASMSGHNLHLVAISTVSMLLACATKLPIRGFK